MSASKSTGIGTTPVTHYAYVTEDIERAAHQWNKAFGAGPFFLFENIEFESLETPDGSRAVFEHSTALGQWGPIAIELQQIDRIEPESLRSKLVPDPLGVTHTSYISPDIDACTARLEGLGFEKFLVAETGPFHLTFFEVPGAGHTVEVYRDNEFVREFFPALAAAAAGWDGSDLVRPGPPT